MYHPTDIASQSSPVTGSVCAPEHFTHRTFILTHHAGPEVVDQAVRVLELVSATSSEFDLKLESHLFGGCAIDAVGESLPDSTLKACQEADAILMGIYVPDPVKTGLSLMSCRFCRWSEMGCGCQSTSRAWLAEAS